MSGNALTNALFQLAICGGSLAVPQNLVPINKMSKTSDKINMEDKATTSLPSEGIDTGCHVFVTHLLNLDAHDLLCSVSQLN